MKFDRIMHKREISDLLLCLCRQDKFLSDVGKLIGGRLMFIGLDNADQFVVLLAVCIVGRACEYFGI